MKKIHLFLAGCLFLSLSVNANTLNKTSNQTPFIFIENGIEYAVFNNGDFDFNIIKRPTSNINLKLRNINLSFNTGGNYKPNIQQNKYGEITKINRTSIFYNRYGKVSRIGSININYNYRGLISNIGNLNVYYSSYGNSYSHRGYINKTNINYKPYYKFYKKPTVRKTVVYNKNSNNRKSYATNKYIKQKYSKYNNKYSVDKSNNYKTNKYQNNKPSTKKTSKAIVTQKKTYTTNENNSYRANTNSYRRNSTGSDSRYVSNSSTNNYKKR